MSINFLHYLYDVKAFLPDREEYYSSLLLEKDFLANGPQIYSLLNQQEMFEQIPMFFQKAIKEKFKESYFQNLFIKNQLKKIFKILENNSIDVIPLKGVFFAERYFGHLGARPTSDIDLLIKPQDLNKGIKCVKILGFTIEEEPKKGHFHCSFSKTLPGSEIPLTVELHWDLLQEKTSTFKVEEFWTEAKDVEPYHHVKRLSDYHTFYMICLHGWRHNMDSLKYYLDIIQMIYKVRHKLDYKRLVDDAARHKTLKRITRTLTIVYQECPFVEEIKPFPYKRSSRYLEYDAKKRDGIKNYKRYVDFIDYQFLSYDSVGYKFRELVRWIKTNNI
ncbi:nucleotidyltransferase family protein [Mesobacillus foraminis]|uniref:nucleotidyltransferase family protein n=1 Tax=Mesobacillus foraminis TaxID=279826 RepID=UPI001BEBF9C8|nr:nucleotidyltransferase family protein [Mesobacillus foraminis]MBT2758392.1 nucleotidyltransferase family protein [Mesobacillus foraminis]